MVNADHVICRAERCPIGESQIEWMTAILPIIPISGHSFMWKFRFCQRIKTISLWDHVTCFIMADVYSVHDGLVGHISFY